MREIPNLAEQAVDAATIDACPDISPPITPQDRGALRHPVNSNGSEQAGRRQVAAPSADWKPAGSDALTTLPRFTANPLVWKRGILTVSYIGGDPGPLRWHRVFGSL